MINRNWEKEPEFSDLSLESIKDYRDSMEQTYDVILRNRTQFIRDLSFPIQFKIDKMDELLDFFLIDGDLERSSKLYIIKDLLEMKLIINNE